MPRTRTGRGKTNTPVAENTPVAKSNYDTSPSPSHRHNTRYSERRRFRTQARVHVCMLDATPIGLDTVDWAKLRSGRRSPGPRRVVRFENESPDSMSQEEMEEEDFDDHVQYFHDTDSDIDDPTTRLFQEEDILEDDNQEDAGGAVDHFFNEDDYEESDLTWRKRAAAAGQSFVAKKASAAFSAVRSAAGSVFNSCRRGAVYLFEERASIFVALLVIASIYFFGGLIAKGIAESAGNVEIDLRTTIKNIYHRSEPAVPSSLAADMPALKEHISTALAALSSGFAATQEEVATLMSDQLNKRIANNVGEVKAGLNEALESIQTIRKQLESVDGRTGAVETAILRIDGLEAALQEAISTQNSNTEERIRESAASMEQSLSELRAALQDVNSQVEAGRAETSSVSTSVDNLRRDVDKAASALDGLEDRMLEATHTAMEGSEQATHSFVEAKEAEMKDAIALVRQEVGDLADRLDALATELPERINQVEIIANSRPTSDGSEPTPAPVIVDHSGDFASPSDLDDVRSTLADRIAQIENQFRDAVNEARESLSGEIAGVEDKVAESLERVEELRTSIASTTGAVREELKSELAAVERALEAKIEAAVSGAVEHQGDAFDGKLSESIKDVRSEVDAAILDVEAKVNAGIDRIDELERQMGAQSKESDDYSKIKDELKEEITAVEHAIEAKVGSIINEAVRAHTEGQDGKASESVADIKGVLSGEIAGVEDKVAESLERVEELRTSIASTTGAVREELKSELAAVERALEAKIEAGIAKALEAARSSQAPADVSDAVSELRRDILTYMKEEYVNVEYLKSELNEVVSGRGRNGMGLLDEDALATSVDQAVRKRLEADMSRYLAGHTVDVDSVSEERIRLMIEDALEDYSADRVTEVDYANYLLGGSIDWKKTSWAYQNGMFLTFLHSIDWMCQSKTAGTVLFIIFSGFIGYLLGHMIKLTSFKSIGSGDFKLPLDHYSLFVIFAVMSLCISLNAKHYSPPEIILQARNVNTAVGKCYALSGTSGKISIIPFQPIVPKSFTLEHVHQAVSRDPRSAPRGFRVRGYGPNLPSNGLVLGEYEYSLKKRHVQTFNVTTKNTQLVNRLSLEITSNHGNPLWTCVYRFRVHADVDK